MELSFPNYVNTRNMKQMKELCRTLDLSQCGSRQELQQRILSYAEAVGYHRYSDFVDKSVGLDQEDDYTNLQCVCGIHRCKFSKLAIQCTKCSSLQHRTCIRPCFHLQPYECPRCQLEQLDPFHSVLQFLTVPTLVSNSDTQDALISFTLPTPVLESLQEPESKYQVQVRCLKLDRSGYNHAWPIDVMLFFDKKPIFELHSSAAELGKRKDFPVNLSVDSLAHSISCVKYRDNLNYVMAVVLTRKKTAGEVIGGVLEGKSMSVREGKAFISSLFNGSEDLQTATFRQSLRCPLTHLVVETPVRGWKCKHVQCFDLRSYVILQEKATVNKWRCPICLANCCKLVVDKYWERITAAALMLENCDITELRASGDYRLIQNIPDSPSGQSFFPSSFKRKQLPLISLTKTPKLLSSKPANLRKRSQFFCWKDFKELKIAERELFSSEVYYQIGLMRFQQICNSISAAVNEEQKQALAQRKYQSKETNAKKAGQPITSRTAGTSICPINIGD